MSEVIIRVKGGSYPIRINDGGIDQIHTILSELEFGGKKSAIITDGNVAPHYLSIVKQALPMQTTHHVIPAGEQSKSLAMVTVLCSELIQSGHDRQSFIIALGGGVVGDLAGFVASIFYRGVPFIQIPTTSVSQVDSSVGGKTGVNTPEGKNLVGAFHHPRAVIIDPQLLSTLPRREYFEGYAEVIKHACIRDRSMLDLLPEQAVCGAPLSVELLERNIQIKGAIVEEDEKEISGVRALLNFGHTIGHGIEASVPYGELFHGEAIALGIRAALYLSNKCSSLTESETLQILSLLQRFELPLVLPEHLDTQTILEKIEKDKKFQSGQIQFVLLRRIGEAFVTSDLTMVDIADAIKFLRSPVR